MPEYAAFRKFRDSVLHRIFHKLKKLGKNRRKMAVLASVYVLFLEIVEMRANMEV